MLPMNPVAAVHAARSTDMDTLIGAREFAESLGYESFDTKAPMPPEFDGVGVLSEGFAEGLSNARCEYAQIQAGFL